MTKKCIYNILELNHNFKINLKSKVFFYEYECSIYREIDNQVDW